MDQVSLAILPQVNIDMKETKILKGGEWEDFFFNETLAILKNTCSILSNLILVSMAARAAAGNIEIKVLFFCRFQKHRAGNVTLPKAHMCFRIKKEFIN